MDEIRNFIEQNKLYEFRLYNSKVFYADTKDISKLTYVWNSNFYFITVCEKCFVIPKLCAIRWGYFSMITKYSQEKYEIVHIDITNILLDSKLLMNINYAYFPDNFVRVIQGNNLYKVFYTDIDVEQWKTFVELLIPPSNYFENPYKETDESLDLEVDL
tara:strand:- start:9405 stop:9881 length:477 start_codon:yes stop_codon:yes gene_type:complete